MAVKKPVVRLTKLFNPEQEFFARAACARRLPHLAVAIFLPVVFIILGVTTGETLIFQILLGEPSIPPIARKLYSFTVTIGLVILILWLWIRFVEQRPFWTIGLPKQSILRHYSFGFLSGMLMMLCVVGLIALLGNIVIQPRSSSVPFTSIVTSAILMLFGFMIQGANEEFIARGWHFQVIGRRYSPQLGALISSLFFVLLHVGAPGANIVALLNLLLFSLLLILFVLKDQSIWAACGWHSAWNWTMGPVLGLEVSGREQTGALFQLNLDGPDLISGGEYGPEGSIMATIVLLGGIIILLSRRRST